MGKKDPRVDAYIESAADFAKPILNHLRRLVHKVCPEVEETWKWSFPHFIYKGMFCHMAAFKKHCAFGFWHKSARDTIEDNKSGDAMGQLGKITSLADLPRDAVLTRYLKHAMKLNEAGIKSPIKRATPKPLKIPDNVKAALQTNPLARANFKKLSPSHQREYVEWIAEAKREETVNKRLTTMLQWLAEGKSRNWKYEK
jgi:uncharacterized protein YdeI (YjbR/CyaY-like superfamily)